MLLLIGNFLSKHGLNPTAIEDLAIVLSKKNEIEISSDKRNPLCRISHMVTSVIKNRRYCKLIIVDVFSTYALLFTFIVIVLAKLFKIPYIPVLRGGNLPEKYKKYPYIFNFLFSSSSIVVCPSKYLQQYFRGKSFKTTIIPNYIDCKNYSFKIRQEIRPRLLWVRSIHNIYNPYMAIHVLDQIQKIYPNARLCMVGPVKDEKLMEELIKLVNNLNLNEHITFSGKMSKIGWIKLSENYDIFINTTDFDNHPVSVIEAMGLGLPVISTNVGGISYLIQDGENGLLVDKRDVMEMVKKIKSLINGEINSELISINARKYIENFDLSIILSQWQELISSRNRT